MKNYETEAAWAYHNGTKHPNGILLDRYHRYSAKDRPLPYKQYKGASKIKLAPDKSPGKATALDAISLPPIQGQVHIPTFDILSRILYFSCGITKTIDFGQPLGKVEFRAAPCTGALYHIEAYLVCGQIPGLDAGIYHYSPEDNSLSIVRTGDYRRFLSVATGNEYSASTAPATLVFTDVFQRNSIKYQAREYRHAFWDCGVIIANSLAVACAHHTPCKVVLGFSDAAVNQLLGIDGKKEAAIAVLPLGHIPEPLPPSPPQDSTPEAKPLEFATVPEAVLEMHESSALVADEVSKWRERSKQGIAHFPVNGPEAGAAESLEATITKRGSTRKFSHDPISLAQFLAVLGRSTRGFPADFQADIDMYLIANAVDGLEPGAYFFNLQAGTFEILKQGNLRDISGHLGLDQMLPYDAAATIFFMSDLKEILERLGNRGYRAAQMASAITAGRMYLAAYAVGIGATGLTFYDDAVTEFFGPHSQDKSTMFLLALGKKQKRN